MKRYHVYKAVREWENGDLGSLIVDNSSDFYINYIPKKYVTPKIGKIFAFGDILSTKSFTRWKYKSNYQIWECLTTEKPISCYATILNFVQIDYNMLMREYWQDFRSGHDTKDSNLYTSPPFRTVLCNDLKLWKLIL